MFQVFDGLSRAKRKKKQKERGHVEESSQNEQVRKEALMCEPAVTT